MALTAYWTRVPIIHGALGAVKGSQLTLAKNDATGSEEDSMCGSVDSHADVNSSHFWALYGPKAESWQTLTRGTVAISLPPTVVVLKAFQVDLEGQHDSDGKQRQLLLTAAADIKAGTMARSAMSRAVLRTCVKAQTSI